MIRKLLIQDALVGLLGGCVSAGYGYGYGDGYYYGQPSVQYRYGYGYPQGYGYPYGYSYPYGYGYPYGYSHPYGYSYPYGYGYSPYRYYNYPYRPDYYQHHNHGHGHNHHQNPPPVTGPQPGDGHGHDDDNPPPWRDFNRHRRFGEVAGSALQTQGTIQQRPQPQQPTQTVTPRHESSGNGSRMQQVIKRAQESRRHESGTTQEP